MRFISRFFAICLLVILLCGPVFARGYNGAAAKLPYPMRSRDLSLVKQDVKITVYSTFIEFEADYTVQNKSESDVIATIGFPIYRNSTDVARGETPPLNIKVFKNRKEDFFVKKKVEKDQRGGGYFKEWYLWEVDVRRKRNASFKVHYYMRMTRHNGVPHFTYTLKEAKAYKGKVGSTNIRLNMPLSCKDMPFTTTPLYDGSSFLHTSLPKPKVSRNYMHWDFDDHLPLNDLEVYFYKNGFPDWEVVSSSGRDKKDVSSGNVLDGNPRTYWMSSEKNHGIGSWLQFTPVIRDRKGNTRSFSPEVKSMGVIPGNTRTLSDFYDYSHLMEAEVEVYIKPSKNKKEENEKKNDEKKVEKDKEPDVDRPTDLSNVPLRHHRRKRKEKKHDAIVMECKADPVLQIFNARKPLLTTDGPLRMLMTMVYQGQSKDPLCISEVLIFDREPNEVYDY